MNKSITIVDYGLGNLHSVHKALIQVAPHWQINISDKSEDLHKADKVVFPGVGAIGACINGLEQRGLSQAIIEAAHNKPMLAICVGFQALFAENEEDPSLQGLGILPGKVVKFNISTDINSNPQQKAIKVPHIGWSRIKIQRQSPYWKGIEKMPWMYFVHSYHPQPQQKEHLAATCHHGINFAACCIKDQLIGCQFHPEKSHRNGLQLLTNFVNEI